MNYLDIIQECPEEELDERIRRKIKKLETRAKKKNPNVHTIGYEVGEDTERKPLFELNGVKCFEIILHSFYNRFIPKGTKVVFGMSYDMTGEVGNGGSYYYLDDDSYIYDFCHYIKDKDIDFEIELFDYLLEFVQNYFGHTQIVDRYQMYRMVLDENGNCFHGEKKHSFKDFKGKGNALCSEISVMVQNILRFLDYESYLVMGNQHIEGLPPGSHAFNFITYKRDGKKVHELLDFTSTVSLFDIDLNKIGELPFIGHLDSLDQDFVKDFTQKEKHLKFKNHSRMIIGDSLITLEYDEYGRDYFVSDEMIPLTKNERQKAYRIQL